MASTAASDKETKPAEKTIKVRIAAALHTPDPDAPMPVDMADGTMRGVPKIKIIQPFEEIELPETEARYLMAAFPGSCEVGKESPELQAEIAAAAAKKKKEAELKAQGLTPPIAPPGTPSQKPTPPTTVEPA